MITDARALKPEFVPRDLHHREGQIDHLSSVLAPLQYDTAENVTIFGPSGSGKTTIAKYVVTQLERETLGIRWGYVDGMSDNTTTAALHRLVREVNLGADLRRRGEPTALALDRLRECDDQVVAILDEVSVLEERPLVALANLPNVSLVAITIDEEEWLDSLGRPATSRMQSAATVRLEKYSLQELIDILDSRVSHGLIKSRVDDEAVRRAADIAAGDARRGIALLRRAAKRLEETDERQLTVETIENVVGAAERDIQQRRVRSLGTHQRLLYNIIADAGEISGTELADEYERRSVDPKSDPTRRRYLKSLRQYGLIEASGEGRARRYRSVT
ncbi:Cdc6/Cdc18 family protein [Halosimplex pelagicum]|uniref:AAA family ATPase n=1 Tax=Halosimplex pelagicum TaxID=869886 RepID=A0A7D5T5G4_9EURY|nr:Cdc6/Cdc18 family protein [Halosimplex pelagicum]QLH83411.1 AAA family ATPase [Halosimplex pelagicum]